jgi:sigma-B regulation protein RsbU (phosphoserine phosphatase)
MATAPQPVAPPHKDDFGTKMNQFWRRVTDGLELNQLWTQFQTEARASYRLYARDVDSTRHEGVRPGRHWFDISKQFFWAVMEKLSPARRILLLIALLLIIINPQFVFQDKQGVNQIVNLDFRLWGGLLMFALLILEVGDRVVMKRDLQIAREIQLWLLPANPPQVPDLEIAFATRPANTVAGDYYDVFPLPTTEGQSQRFLLSVADVAGKSIPAALLMATFQASLKTLTTAARPLLEVVDGMNRYACCNSQGGLRFTTAFLAEYDPADRSLNYVNAGHNTPMLRRTSGSIERLEAGGLPLGIQSDAVYESGTVTLAAGDWLAIFTDGLVEAINDRDEEYGEERLVWVLNAGASISPPKLLSRIMVDLDTFVGATPQHDDVTCMLLRAS